MALQAQTKRKRWAALAGLALGGLVLAGLVSAVLLAGGCSGGGHDAGEPAAEPSPVVATTATAAWTDTPRSVTASGAVAAIARSTVASKLMGRIEAMPVREGEPIREGDLLALLDHRDLDAAVAQAGAALTMARAQHANAESQHRRMERLHGRGAVTDKAREDAAAAFRIAEASIVQAQANLRAAEVQRGYAEVESPLSGWVTARHAEAGDLAAPGRPLVTVEDLSTVEIRAEVPEAAVVGLTEGGSAEVELTVLGRRQPAEIHRVVPAGDPASRTFSVRLRLPNPDGAIKSGMFARVHLDRGGSERRLLVPATALVRRGQLDGLYLVEQGRAVLRWVRLGQVREGEGGTVVEILSGLEPGERFIVEPPPDLVDGTPIVEGAER